jgi:mono/diheme cytochrome c family protein
MADSSARYRPGFPPRVAGAWPLLCLLLGLSLPLRVPGRGQAASPTNAPSLEAPAPDDDRVRQGRFVFERHCQVCHGRWGDGRGEMALGMFPKPRRLTSGIFKYHTTPAGKLPAEADLARTIRSGLPGTAMPAFTQLQDREIFAVIGYVQTLSPRWRWATNHATPLPRPQEPDWLGDRGQQAVHARAGAAHFAQLCAPCHGMAADGKGPAAAALEDVWGQPAPPADLRQAVGRSGPTPSDLFRVVDQGIDGTPMPAFGGAIPVEAQWELVAYILERREDFRRSGAQE